MCPPHLGSPQPSPEHSEEKRLLLSPQRRFQILSLPPPHKNFTVAQLLQCFVCRACIVNHPAQWVTSTLGCWGDLWPQGHGATAAAGPGPPAGQPSSGAPVSRPLRDRSSWGPAALFKHFIREGRAPGVSLALDHAGRCSSPTSMLSQS